MKKLLFIFPYFLKMHFFNEYVKFGAISFKGWIFVDNPFAINIRI